MSIDDPRALLADSFNAALAAVDPIKIVPQHLPQPPKGRTVVVGAGKAAASMALAVEQHWPARASLEGLVITRYGHGALTNRIRVVEAGHPLPDEAVVHAAEEVRRLVRSVRKDDLLLVLVSGGGSSLLGLPAEGVALAELRQVASALLRSGAPVEKINVVRKHLSPMLGGNLAAQCRARVCALIISDVTHDDPADIASGPCAADHTTYGDALAIMEEFGIEPPDAVAKHLQRGKAGEIAETPKPGDERLRNAENIVIARSQMAIQAGARLLRTRGIPAFVIGDAVTGEASQVARMQAAMALQVASYGEPWPAPVALLSGGECSVTVRGNGRGGRCSEFLLAFGLAVEGLHAPRIWGLACDTDGIDGMEANAGAALTPRTLGIARARSIDPRKSLLENDAWPVFSATGDLVMTGPTRTNVNDYRVILIT
jgi:glycerate 2-kinase